MRKIIFTVLVMIALLCILNSCESIKVPNKSQIKTLTVDLSNENVVSSGIKEVSTSVFQLDTKFKQPQQFTVYYGELKYSGITDYSVYDFLIVSDKNVESVSKVRNQGAKVFQYLSFGSRFEDTDTFIESTKETIKSLHKQGLADGIFLDECDIAYWDISFQNNLEKQQRFYERLKEITHYIDSIGMESVINGTSSFSDLGDYFMWESFLSYWNSNQIKWGTTIDRTTSSNGSVTYGRTFSDWTFEGTTHVENGKVVGGENGAMEIVLDLDQILESEDIRETYDWVYTEWLGNGGTDETISIWAWTGESMPFDSNTWTLLPRLWEGEAKSWNGLGSSSKFLKLRFEFNGAPDLVMEQLLLTFNYNYPYWDMNQSNGSADTDPYMWNFNNNQLNYIHDKINTSNKPIKILTQSYGEKFDVEKVRYTLLGTAINNFHAWNYAQPMMQTIEYQDIMEEPIGMLLKRETVGNVTTGYFTGSTASIDTTLNTYTLKRNEPTYYYDSAITIDGDMTDWVENDQLYNKQGPSFSAAKQFWGANIDSYSSGEFDNVQVITRDEFPVLELINDGIGTWTSQELGMDPYNYKKQLSELMWNGGSGLVNYFVQFQKADDSWTDWLPQTQGTSYPLIDFYKFRVKVTLEGLASHEKIDPLTNESVFIQGVSFWGSSHIWEIYLSDDANVQALWMTDDRKYLYIRFRTKGQIDFSTNDNVLSENYYNIYLDTLPESNDGFEGTWWNSPHLSAKYRITNNGLYKWKENFADKHSQDGWEWLGTASINYKLNASKDEIEYRIKKSDLGGMTSQNIKFYMTAEEALTLYGNFVKPDELDATTYNGQLIYRQKQFSTHVPHGYIQSDIIEIEEGRNATLTWEESTPESTSTKAWIRTRTPGNQLWNDWTIISNGQIIKESFDRIQYCFGLYTNVGDSTPQISNINLSLEEIYKENEEQYSGKK